MGLKGKFRYLDWLCMETFHAPRNMIYLKDKKDKWYCYKLYAFTMCISSQRILSRQGPLYLMNHKNKVMSYTPKDYLRPF